MIFGSIMDERGVGGSEFHTNKILEALDETRTRLEEIARDNGRLRSGHNLEVDGEENNILLNEDDLMMYGGEKLVSDATDSDRDILNR